MSPSAYWDGSAWYPQVTFNCYGPPPYEGYRYDEDGLGAGIWMNWPYDCGATWGVPIRVAGLIGVDEYFSRLVPTTTYVPGADSGSAYILTMPTGGDNGPLDMIRVPYPAATQFEVAAQVAGGQVTLGWSPVNQASAFWVYGASNDPWFAPGMAPGYEHRVAVLPGSSASWSSAAGVGDPFNNWTYLVKAVTSSEQVFATSNRVGEQDVEGDIP